MKSPDRFLLAIVAGILLLVGIGLGVALWEEGPTYRTDERPENVAHNYLLALYLRDYERAYGYLAPTLANYPDINAFREGARFGFWNYSNDRGESIGIEILNVTVSGTHATVQARVNRYYGRGFGSGWWFDNGTAYGTEVRMELDEIASGSWKLTKSDDFWDICWHSPSTCD